MPIDAKASLQAAGLGNLSGTDDWSLGVTEENARNFELDNRAIADFRKYLKSNGVFTGDVDNLKDDDVIKETVSSMRWRNGNTASTLFDAVQTNFMNNPDENARRARIQRWFNARPTMFDDAKNADGSDFGEGLASYGAAAVLDPLNLVSFGAAGAAVKSAVAGKQLLAREAGKEVAEGLLSTGIKAGAAAGAKAGVAEGAVGGFIQDYLGQYRDEALGLRADTSIGEALVTGGIGGAAVGGALGGVIGGLTGAASRKAGQAMGDQAYEAKLLLEQQKAAAATATSMSPATETGVQFQSLLDEVPVEKRNVLNEALSQSIEQLQERRSPLVHQIDGSPINKDVAKEVEVLNGLIGRLQDMQRAPELVQTLSAQAEAALKRGDDVTASALSGRAASFADAYRRFVGEGDLTPNNVVDLANNIFSTATTTADSILSGMNARTAAAAPTVVNTQQSAAKPQTNQIEPVVNTQQSGGPAEPPAAPPAAPAVMAEPGAAIATDAVGAPVVMTPAEPAPPASIDGETFFADLLGEGGQTPQPTAANIVESAAMANDMFSQGGVMPDGTRVNVGAAAAQDAATPAAAPALTDAPAPTVVATAPVAEQGLAGIQKRLDDVGQAIATLAAKKGKSADENATLKAARELKKSLAEELKATKEAEAAAPKLDEAPAAVDQPTTEQIEVLQNRNEKPFDQELDGSSDTTTVNFIQGLGFSDLEADSFLTYVRDKSDTLGRELTEEETRAAAAGMAKLKAQGREAAASILDDSGDNLNLALVAAKDQFSADPVLGAVVDSELRAAALKRFWDAPQVVGQMYTLLSKGQDAQVRSALMTAYPKDMVDAIIGDVPTKGSPLRQRVDLTGVPNDVAASIRLESERYKQRLISAGFNANDATAISQGFLDGLKTEAKATVSRGEQYVTPSQRGINAFATGKVAADPVKSMVSAVVGIANSLDPKMRENPETYQWLAHGLLSASDGVLLRGILRPEMDVVDYLSYLGGSVSAPRQKLIGALIEAGRTDALGIGKSRERVFNADIPGRLQGILRKSNMHGFFGKLNFRGTWSAEDQALSRAHFAISQAFAEATNGAKATGAMRNSPTMRKFSMTSVQEAANSLNSPVVSDLVDRIANAIYAGSAPDLKVLGSMAEELEKSIKEIRKNFETQIKVNRKTGDPGELLRARKDIMQAISMATNEAGKPINAAELLAMIDERAKQRAAAQSTLTSLERKYAGQLKANSAESDRTRGQIAKLEGEAANTTPPVGAELLSAARANKSSAATAVYEAQRALDEIKAKGGDETMVARAQEKVASAEAEYSKYTKEVESLLGQQSGALQKYGEFTTKNKADIESLKSQLKGLEKIPDDLRQARTDIYGLDKAVDSLAGRSVAELESLRDSLRANANLFDQYSRQIQLTKTISSQVKALREIGTQTSDGVVIGFNPIKTSDASGKAVVNDMVIEFFADPHSGNVYGTRNAAAASTNLSLRLYRQSEILDAAIADMIAKGEVSPALFDTEAGQGLRAKVVSGMSPDAQGNDMMQVARQLLGDKQLGVKDPDDATRSAMREFRRQFLARVDGINRRYGMPIVQKRAGDAVQDEILMAKKMASAVLHGQVNQDILNAKTLDILSKVGDGTPNSQVEKELRDLITQAKSAPRAPMGSANGVEVNFATDITASAQPDGSSIIRYKGVDVAKAIKGADGSPALVDTASGIIYPASREAMLKIVEPHAKQAAEQGLAVSSRVQPLKQQFVYDNGLHKDTPVSSLIAADNPLVLSRSAKEIGVPETHRLAVRYQGMVYRESESVRRKGGMQSVKDFLPENLRSMSDSELMKQVEVGTVIKNASENSQATVLTFRSLTDVPFQTEQKLKLPQPKRSFLSIKEAESRKITAADVSFLPAAKQQRFIGVSALDLNNTILHGELGSFSDLARDAKGQINPAQWLYTVNDIQERLAVLSKVAPNGINLAVQSRYAAEKELLGIFSRSSPTEIANAMAVLARIKGDSLPNFAVKAESPDTAGFIDASLMGKRVLQEKRNKVTGERDYVEVDGKATVNLNPNFNQGVPRSFTLAHEVAHWAYFNVLTPTERVEWWNYLKTKTVRADGTIDDTFLKMWANPLNAKQAATAEGQLPQEVFANLFTRWLGENKAYIGGETMWARLVDKIRAIVNMFLGKGDSVVDHEAAAIFEKFFDISDGFQNSSALGRFKHQLIGVGADTNESTRGLVNVFNSVSDLRGALAKAIDDGNPFELHDVLFGKYTPGSGTGVMRWMYGNLWHTPKKSAGGMSMFSDNASIYKRGSTAIDAGMGDRAPEMTTAVDTLYNYVKNINKELYEEFRTIAEKSGASDPGMDIEKFMGDVGDHEYGDMWEAMSSKLQENAGDADRLMQLGIRTITALDKFGYSVANDIMRVSQSPVRAVMKEFNLNSDGSMKNAWTNGKVARILKAKDDRALVAQEARNAVAEVASAHSSIESMVGSSVFGDSVHKMTPAALVIEYRSAGKDSVRGREIAFEFGRRAMTDPEFQSRVSPSEMSEMRQKFGPKTAAFELTEALIAGDRDRANKAAALLSFYHNDRNMALLPLKQQIVIDAVDAELKLREGESNYVGVPASASAHVAEALVSMTHRDPAAQNTLRTITYRLLNLMSKKVGGVLDEATIVDQNTINRLMNNSDVGTKALGVTLDLRSQEFMDLRKKLRSFAISVASDDKAPSATLVHEIGHVVRRALFTAEDDSRMVAAFIKSLGAGETASFQALTSPMSPDPAVLRAAEEWWTEGLVKYMGERIGRGDLASGSLELKPWHENALDTVKEGIAYVFNGLIGNKSMRQDYRQLTWFGDMFDIHKDHRATLVSSAGVYADSIPTTAFKGYASDFERIAPRAKIDIARAFASVGQDDALANHVYGVYSFKDGISRMFLGKDADRAVSFIDAHAEQRLNEMGDKAGKEVRDIVSELNGVRSKLTLDTNINATKREELRELERVLTQEIRNKTGGYQLAMEVSPVVARVKNPLVFESEDAFNAAAEASGGMNAMIAAIKQSGHFDSVKIKRNGEFGTSFYEMMVLDSNDLMSLAAKEERLAKDLVAIRAQEVAPDQMPLTTTLLAARSTDVLKQSVGDFAAMSTNNGVNQSMFATIRRLIRGEQNGQDVNRVADLSGGIQISTNSHQVRKLGGSWFADFIKPLGGAGFYERHYASLGKETIPILEALGNLPDAGGAVKNWWRRSAPMFAPPEFVRNSRVGKYVAWMPGEKADVPSSYNNIYMGLIKNDFRGLNKEEEKAARMISGYFDGQLKRMQALGMMVGDVKKYDIGYVPQVWDVEAIQTNRDEFRNALAQYFIADQAKNGNRLTLTDALSRAQKTIDRLTAEEGVPLPNDRRDSFRGGDELMRRVFNFSASDVSVLGLDKFLVKDLDSLLMHYADTTSRKIAMVEKFGVNNHGFDAYHSIMAAGRDALEDLLLNRKTQSMTYWADSLGRELRVEQPLLAPVTQFPEEAAKISDALANIFMKYENPHDAKAEAKKFLLDLYRDPKTLNEFSKRADAIVNGLADFGFQGGSVSKPGHKFTGEMFDRLTNKPGSGSYDYDAATQFSKTVKGINSMALLGFTVLTSIPDVAMSGITSGRFGPWVKGMRDFMRFDEAGAEYRRGIRQIGTAIENIGYDRMTNLHGASGSRRSNAFFHMNLLTGWTNMMRNVSSSVALESFITEQAIAQRLAVEGKTESRAFKRAVRHLERFGLGDYAKADAPRIDKLQLEKLQDDVREGVHRFVQESIFAPTKDDIPLWAQGPWTSIMFQLKSYPLMMGRMARRVAEEAKEGNVGPMMMVVAAGMPLAAVSLGLKDVVQSRGGEDQRSMAFRDRALQGSNSTGNKDMDLILGWGMESFAQFGGFGLLADMMYSTAASLDNGYYGMWRALSTVFGPSASTIGETAFNVGAGIQEAITEPDKNSKQRAAVRSLVNVTPFVGGVKGARESIVDNTAGELFVEDKNPLQEQSGFMTGRNPLKPSGGFMQLSMGKPTPNK